MKIKLGFDIEFELPGPTPMILMLYVHPSRQADLLSEERIMVEPNVPLH
nr:transglutaminase family protein [Chthoniobacterales bacterium]